MSDQKITLTRAELYEKVWKMPICKLAREFSISDVGLAKLCRRHEIPLPGVGYWQLPEDRRSSRRKPLPTTQESESIAIPVRKPRPYELPRRADLGSLPAIEVKNNDEITHPLTLRTKKVFQPTSKSESGAMIPKVVNAPHVRISANMLFRVLRILDALFHAVEKQNYSVRWPTGADARLQIVVGGEQISPCITEMFSRKPHTPTPDEIARRKKNLYVYAPNWDYISTGELRLSIDNLPYELTHVRKSWSDSERRRIENCLSEFVAMLPHLAKSLKLVREDNERERLQREEEEKRAEEKKRKREEYQRRAGVVKEFLASWKQSNTYREFAVAMREKISSSSATDDQKKQVAEMSKWIARHADNIDPLNHFDWMIEQFNDPPWKYNW